MSARSEERRREQRAKAGRRVRIPGGGVYPPGLWFDAINWDGSWRFAFVLVTEPEEPWTPEEVRAITKGRVVWNFFPLPAEHVSGVMVKAGDFAWQRAWFSLGNLAQEQEWPQREEPPECPGHNTYSCSIILTNTTGKIHGQRHQYWGTEMSDHWDNLMRHQRAHLDTWSRDGAEEEIAALEKIAPTPNVLALDPRSAPPVSVHIVNQGGPDSKVILDDEPIGMEQFARTFAPRSEDVHARGSLIQDFKAGRFGFGKTGTMVRRLPPRRKN
jgi:hypothetical protein